MCNSTWRRSPVYTSSAGFRHRLPQLISERRLLAGRCDPNDLRSRFEAHYLPVLNLAEAIDSYTAALKCDPEFVLANDYANLVKVYQFWNLHALLGGEIEKLLNHPLLEVMEVKRRVENPLQQSQGECVMFTVIDSGPGIPDEDLPYIFDPYYQASNRKGQIGTGLGLAIVKRIATAHGGDVAVKSHLGIGTSFSIFIPAEES